MPLVGVIANSGKSLGDGLSGLREALAREGVDDPLWREVPKGKLIPDATRELIDAGAQLLFVWGGDGSLQRCVDAVGDAPVAVAVLPAGTANLFAGNLGIPANIDEAVRIGLHGRRQEIDLGTVNGERFAVMAGCGFDADMIRTADSGLKERLGRLGYIAGAVRATAREPVAMQVKIDGADWFEGAATCVLVGNMGRIMGGISLFPDARPDDGRLDVGVITADSFVDWARMLARTALGQSESSPFVETTTAAKTEVHLETKVPYEVDGGSRGKADKLVFEVRPAAITVCVPLRKAAS